MYIIIFLYFFEVIAYSFLSKLWNCDQIQKPLMESVHWKTRDLHSLFLSLCDSLGG